MRPAIFADLDFAAARDRATTEGKLLVVDATASWCGPCQMMDRTTWVDARVIDALGARAIAIQVDVDAHQEVARELRIQVMPTLIAFKAGVEFDRVSGAHTPDQLISWVDAVERGETSIQAARQAVVANPENMRTRIQHLRMLARAGRYDEATTEHVWFWQHALEHDPAMRGVRRSFFLRDLERLAAAHPPARVAIIELRDAVSPDRAPDVESLIDWICLNEALVDAAATLAWFDAQPEPKQRRVPVPVRTRVRDLLVVADRWADAGTLVDEPIADVNQAASSMASVLETILKNAKTPEQAEQARGFTAARFRETAAMLVRALAAAGRTDDAEATAVCARTLDSSPEMDAAIAAATTAATRVQ